VSSRLRPAAIPDLTSVAGDIVSASVLGQSLIILNSFTSADALLARKGSIYSDRPVLPMGGQLVGGDKFITLRNMGDPLKNARSMLHKTIGTHDAVREYLPVIEDAMRECMLKTASAPDDVATHIRQYVAVRRSSAEFAHRNV
jgi:hypothetical protein